MVGIEKGGNNSGAQLSSLWVYQKLISPNQGENTRENVRFLLDEIALGSSLVTYNIFHYLYLHCLFSLFLKIFYFMCVYIYIYICFLVFCPFLLFSLSFIFFNRTVLVLVYLCVCRVLDQDFVLFFRTCLYTIYIYL